MNPQRAAADRHDLVIVGGGVMGASVAYHLRLLAPHLSVAVLERDPAYAQASSTLSASSIRQQFSQPVNIALSRASFEFLQQAGPLLEVDGEQPDIGLQERGYLYLATPSGESVLREVHAIQRRAGAEVALLDPASLQQRFAWLATDDLALGSLGLGGEGWLDGHALLQAFRRKSRSLGAAWFQGEVTAVERHGSRVCGLACANGRVIACDAMVNACGPQAAVLARLAGIDLPVAPMRHGVFVLECPEEIEGMPLVIDPGGVWFRPEGRRFLAGAPPRDPADAANITLEIDHAQFEDTIWPALARRVPAFEALRVVSSWAGYYEMNLFDANALIGLAPGLDNFYLINGFSGHGLQQAPAAGRALAELIVHGEYRTLDVGALAPDRVAAGRPLRERNII